MWGNLRLRGRGSFGFWPVGKSFGVVRRVFFWFRSEFPARCLLICSQFQYATSSAYIILTNPIPPLLTLTLIPHYKSLILSLSDNSAIKTNLNIWTSYLIQQRWPQQSKKCPLWDSFWSASPNSAISPIRSTINRALEIITSIATITKNLRISLYRSMSPSNTSTFRLWIGFTIC